MLDELQIKDLIKQYKDFPKKGINFKDLNPVYLNPLMLGKILAASCFRLYYFMKKRQASVVVIGIESRGFILGPALAANINAGFIPLRKKGKLPGITITQKYKLEYGHDELEIQKINLRGKVVVIVDDVYATGGTMNAAISLVKKLKPRVIVPLVILDINITKRKPKNMIALVKD